MQILAMRCTPVCDEMMKSPCSAVNQKGSCGSHSQDAAGETMPSYAINDINVQSFPWQDMVASYLQVEPPKANPYDPPLKANLNMRSAVVLESWSPQ